MPFNTEFPDYPAADMPELPEGFEDTSWHHDICPSYSNAHMQIFIDYIDPALREHGNEYPRFTALPIKDGIIITGNSCLVTDDWNEVLAYIIRQ
jgi:hypothetical protein